MRLNKVIVAMLTLFMVLNNVLPVVAIIEKDRLIDQMRKKGSDCMSCEATEEDADSSSSDKNASDVEGIPAKKVRLSSSVQTDQMHEKGSDSMSCEAAEEDADSSSLDKNASDVEGIPAKKVRLSSSVQTEEQSEKCQFDGTKMLVMKFGDRPIKTFTNVLSAAKWLQDSDLRCLVRVNVIERAICKKELLCGCMWEFQDKTEELENLLRSEPKRRQLELIKNYGQKDVCVVGSDELLVMRSEETAVKTFKNTEDAAKWLRLHDWKCINGSSIRHAIYGGWFSCGWKWEIQPRTTVLENLLNAEPTSEQIEMARNYVRKSSFSVDSTKLLVMSLGENSVKTFTSFQNAVDWLAVNGWGNFSDSRSVKRAAQKSCLLCGWKWKIQNKTESLEKLLEVKPTEEQIMEAKKNCEVDETKLLVMKIEGKPIKTFVNISDAAKWLESNIGMLVSCLEINIAIQKQRLLCGWNWEIQDRTEDLELLLGAIPTPKQIKRARNSPQVGIMIDSDKLIVMKFHGKLVKTFASMEDANKWLNKWGWNYKSVTRAINVGCLSCGWNWEIQKRTKDLEELLKVEPTEELINMAKRYVRGKLVLNENELLVMKDEKNTLKTFTEISKAVKWLKLKGCNNICDSDIEKAIAEKSMICGYAWEIHPRTKVLEDLLEANPTMKWEMAIVDYNNGLCMMQGGGAQVKIFTDLSVSAKKIQANSGGQSSCSSAGLTLHFLSKLILDIQDEVDGQGELLISESTVDQVEGEESGIHTTCLVDSMESTTDEV